MRYAGTLEWVAQQFTDRRNAGQHVDAIDGALDALRQRFCDGEGVEGYERDGPVACARFMRGPDEDVEEPRVLEQRGVSGMVTEFLRLVHVASTPST